MCDYPESKYNLRNIQKGHLLFGALTQLSTLLFNPVIVSHGFPIRLYSIKCTISSDIIILFQLLEFCSNRFTIFTQSKSEKHFMELSLNLQDVVTLSAKIHELFHCLASARLLDSFSSFEIFQRFCPRIFRYKFCFPIHPVYQSFLERQRRKNALGAAASIRNSKLFFE